MSHEDILYQNSFFTLWGSARIVLAASLSQVRRWYAIYHERRQLLALDERMLKDIGLNRADVLKECSKPFWRL